MLRYENGVLQKEILAIERNTSEGYIRPVDGNNIDADFALRNFRTWINSTDGLPEHDHAILFTGFVF